MPHFMENRNTKYGIFIFCLTLSCRLTNTVHHSVLQSLSTSHLCFELQDIKKIPMICGRIALFTIIHLNGFPTNLRPLN